MTANCRHCPSCAVVIKGTRILNSALGMKSSCRLLHCTCSWKELYRGLFLCILIHTSMPLYPALGDLHTVTIFPSLLNPCSEKCSSLYPNPCCAPSLALSTLLKLLGELPSHSACFPGSSISSFLQTENTLNPVRAIMRGGVHCWRLRRNK